MLPLPLDAPNVFTDLGFVVPEEFDPLFGDQFYAWISAEQLNMLELVDVVVWSQMAWSPGRQAIEQNPVYASLNASTAGGVTRPLRGSGERRRGIPPETKNRKAGSIQAFRFHLCGGEDLNLHSRNGN